MIEPMHPRPRRWLRPAAGITAGLAAIIALSGATGWAVAGLASREGAPDTTLVRKALKLRLPKTPIDAIVCDGLGGLCEVASKATLFYVDRTAKYLVIGRVYDMEARQDLTAARLLALNPDLLAAGAARRQGSGHDQPTQKASAPARVSLAGLPANGAVTWGPADGPKAIVFSDFNCGYCKKLEAELKAIGARVEERPISVLGAESRRIAEQVICAPHPAIALRAAYSKLALANPKPCDTSGLDANEAFAKAHGFGGTPVVVRPSDGAVLEGFRPAAALREFLTAPAPAPEQKVNTMRKLSSIVVIAVAGTLSGCATFGTNVEGDFSCRAPRGDCAPSHVIDAAATASLSGDIPDLARRPRIGVANDDTTRTSERKLRIVFPAHVDETGTLHDEAVAWAVVENPRWAAELRRKPGDEASPPLMRQLKRQLRASKSRRAEDEALQPAPVDAADLADDASSPFSASPILPFSNASPLVLPSTAREAVAGATAPAVEGFDVPVPPHDRTPRPHGDSPELVFPTSDQIGAAKAKPAPAPKAKPQAEEKQ